VPAIIFVALRPRPRKYGQPELRPIREGRGANALEHIIRNTDIADSYFPAMIAAGQKKVPGL
jgi:hypothetical protein